mmetsp:Transcript_8947/g.10241  ORF Transcript_8947/g.10241 Transcript_8947/m.10241 type:complete len:331 (-) Transcript_8947:236-1228(-)
MPEKKKRKSIFDRNNRKSLFDVFKKKELEAGGVGISVAVQAEGYLKKRKAAAVTWKNRYCLVKDSFFLWYLSRPSDGFNQHPRGVVPLGGAYVGLQPLEESESDVPDTIEIIHPDISEGSFLLKASSPQEASIWLEELKKAKKATWNNATLGALKMKELEEKRMKAENERLEVIENTKKTDALVEKANKDIKKAEARGNKQDEKYKAKLEKANELLLEKMEEKYEVDEAYAQAEHVLEENTLAKHNMKKILDDTLLKVKNMESKWHTEFPELNGDVELVDSMKNLKFSLGADNNVHHVNVAAIGSKFSSPPPPPKKPPPPPMKPSPPKNK